MKASVIVAHPYDKSFNHAIFAAAGEAFSLHGVTLFSHDLYKERFDPALSASELGKEKTDDPLVERYIREMVESDFLVFVHPNWWGQPPAMMKGYIDRVFRPPFAYDYDENDEGAGLPIQKLRGKIGIVFNTSNTDEKRENEYFRDPLEQEWRQCVFGFCGMEICHRRMFRVVASSTREERAAWLDEARKIVADAIEEYDGAD